ncbi:MAG: hypothetical protein PHF35_02410 [Candidatus Moranbacteria bacterium]|nr:hypothetical protein [Candidatus Moranbacteria bacterium]
MNNVKKKRDIEKDQANKTADSKNSPTPDATSTPAPAAPATAATKKYSWLTPVLVIAALIAIGWWVPKQGLGPGSKSTSVPPAFAPAPKPIETSCDSRFLEFIEGNRAEKNGTGVNIKKGGFAQFRTTDFSWRPDAVKIQIIAEVKQARSGNIYLLVNGRRLRPSRSEEGPAFERVFFDNTEGLTPQMLYKGVNLLKIWGDNTISVRTIRIEIVHPK